MEIEKELEKELEALEVIQQKIAATQEAIGNLNTSLNGLSSEQIHVLGRISMLKDLSSAEVQEKK